MKYAYSSLAFGLSASASVLGRRAECDCSFQINVAGGPGSGSLGQLGDGQNRVGPGYGGASYCLNGGSIVDASGRGCILTAPTTQFQCDSGATPTPGFAITSTGSITFNGSPTFYECAVDTTGVYNIYTTPSGTDCHEVTLSSANGACAAAPPAPVTTPAPAPPGTVTVTLPAPPPVTLPPTTVTAPAPPAVTVTAPAPPAVTVTAPAPPAATITAPAPPAVTVTAPAPPAVTVTAPAPPAVTVTAPAPPAATVTAPAPPAVTVTAPAPPAATVTAPAPPAVTVTAPAPPAATITLPAPPAGTVTLPPVTITAPGASAPPAGTVTVTASAGACVPVTVTAPAGAPVTVTAPAGAPVTVTAPAGAPVTVTAPAGAPVTVTAPAGAPVTVTAPAGACVPVTVTAPTPPAPPAVTVTVPGNGGGASTPPAGTGVGTASGSLPPAGTAPAVTPPATVVSPPPGGPTVGTTVKTTDVTVTQVNTPACQTGLSGNYQFPHLIVSVDSANPSTAYGTSYNGELSGTVSSIFNFDIPASYAGHTCQLVFLLPNQADLVTSSYTLAGTGSIQASRLVSPANQGTTFANKPAVAEDLGTFSVVAGSSTVIVSGSCDAGTTASWMLSATGSYALNYFQDFNPAPIGLYVTEC